MTVGNLRPNLRDSWHLGLWPWQNIAHVACRSAFSEELKAKGDSVLGTFWPALSHPLKPHPCSRTMDCFISCTVDWHSGHVVNSAGWTTWGRLVSKVGKDLGNQPLLQRPSWLSSGQTILVFESWIDLPGLLVAFVHLFFPNKTKASIGGSVYSDSSNLLRSYCVPVTT